ncbi:uncharacterized protein KZ484_023079 [Pholidichthys leucotaenia]
MLQQNNNNNYPCLGVSGSTREMLQKCSRASLPFHGRLELGLGGLPLIRGLRAWALCSKNRRKAGALLGQAPTAPPQTGRGSSTTCPRPADMYLSGEWGRMGYGLPLGLDARQAEIGALVATLKTSEGSGKTQTQCLFLRTEKGSCLYSTAKPCPGVTTGTASSVVGGWLRGKTAGGGSGGPMLPAQTGANQVRVRSGRRWRKSSSAAGQERTSRERQQRSREFPASEVPVEERQEEQDKGGLDCKEFPSLQQESRRPICCHSASPKTCTECGRRETQETPHSEARELQKNEEEKEGDKGGLCVSESSGAPSADPQSQRDSPISCNVEEVGEAECNEETKTSHSEESEIGDIPSPKIDEEVTGEYQEVVIDGKPGEEELANVNGFSDCSKVDWESKEEAECEENSTQVPDEFSLGLNGSAHPAESDICATDVDARLTEGRQCREEVNPRFMGEEEENTVRTPHFFVKSEEERDTLRSPLRRRDPSVSEPDGALNPELRNLDGGKGDAILEDSSEGVALNCVSEENGRLWESGWVKENGQMSITTLEPNKPNVPNTACADPPNSLTLSPANPAPSLPLLGSMATGLPCLETEEGEEEEVVSATPGDGEGVQEKRSKIEEQGEAEESCSSVATEDGKKEEEVEEEEDEFGVFMQAEGEPAWSEGFSMSASVPCGSRDSVAPGNHTSTSESAHWTEGWTDSSLYQSHDTWTAFPQDLADEDGGDQWWPASAQEERRDALWTNHNLASVFAAAFPSPPGPSSGDPCDLRTVPTLTQVLQGRAGQDQGLLDSFHDLNKLIGQRYKRANGVSRELLLRTLNVEQPCSESRPAVWAANRRLSPGLRPASQHAQNAAAKRRLSYDYNRNAME